MSEIPDTSRHAVLRSLDGTTVGLSPCGDGVLLGRNVDFSSEGHDFALQYFRKSVTKQRRKPVTMNCLGIFIFLIWSAISFQHIRAQAVCVFMT